jgi:hypothetical protein
MAIDKATLQRRWRVTVSICLAYLAILTLFFVVIFVAPWVPDPGKAKSEPVAQSRATQLAVGGELK